METMDKPAAGGITLGRGAIALGAGAMALALSVGALSGYGLWSDRETVDMERPLAQSWIRYTPAGGEPVTVGDDNAGRIDLGDALAEVAENRAVAVPILIEQLSEGEQEILSWATGSLHGADGKPIPGAQLRLVPVDSPDQCTTPEPGADLDENAEIQHWRPPGEQLSPEFGGHVHEGHWCLRVTLPETIGESGEYTNTGTVTGEWAGEPVTAEDSWTTEVLPEIVDWPTVLGIDPDQDTDGDGVPDYKDDDIDGDDVPNRLDPDIDGDGTPNDEDPTPYGGPGRLVIDLSAKRVMTSQCF